MPNYRVKLATSLLESMTLATVEAFSFRGPRSSSKAGVETYGYVWGSKKTHPNGDIVFFLDKLSISLTAKELCWIFGDGVNQAADFFSDATSIPSRNVTPLTTFGN